MNPLLLLVAATWPGSQPQLAVYRDQVALAYGHQNEVRVAISADRGRTFASSTSLPGDGKLMLGRHRGPRIAFAGAGEPVVTANRDGNLLAWRFTQGAWSGPTRVNDVDLSAREGLHAMSTLPDGRLIAAWLDLRSPGMRIYTSTSRDGASWSKNELVYESPDGHVCECCHPSLSGNLVMWRNWLAGARDMYFATIPSRGLAQKLGQGTWALNACPMDGGGIASHPSHGIGTAWRREKSVYFAQPREAEVELGAGKDAAIAASDAGFWIIWNAPEGIRLAHPDRRVTTLAAAGGYPTIAAAGSFVMAAWENGAGELQVEEVKAAPKQGRYLQVVRQRYATLRQDAEKSIAQIPDEGLHWMPDPESNSIAILMQHLAGNLKSRFTNMMTTDGNKPDRDRDAEFVDQKVRSRADLMKLWKEGWAAAETQLALLKDSDLEETITIGGRKTNALEALEGNLNHAAYHIGQIVYISKHVAGPNWKTLSIPRKR